MISSQEVRVFQKLFIDKCCFEGDGTVLMAPPTNLERKKCQLKINRTSIGRLAGIGKVMATLFYCFKKKKPNRVESVLVGMGQQVGQTGLVPLWPMACISSWPDGANVSSNSDGISIVHCLKLLRTRVRWGRAYTITSTVEVIVVMTTASRARVGISCLRRWRFQLCCFSWWDCYVPVARISSAVSRKEPRLYQSAACSFIGRI